jgi:hypothetical protein
LVFFCSSVAEVPVRKVNFVKFRIKARYSNSQWFGSAFESDPDPEGVKRAKIKGETKPKDRYIVFKKYLKHLL